MFDFMKKLFSNSDPRGGISNNERFYLDWKTRAQSNSLTSYDFIVRAFYKATVVRGPVTTDDRVAVALFLLQKYFTPVTDPVKLSSSYQRNPFYTFWRSWRENTSVGNPHAFMSEMYIPRALDGSLASYLSPVEIMVFKMISRKVYELGETKLASELEKKYVFTFVREDLSPEQVVVQSGHSLFKVGTHIKDAKIDPDKTHFAVIGIPSLEDLLETAADLVHKNIEFVSFFEPDQESEMTSLSTYPIPSRKKESLKNYKLLTFNK